MITMIHKRWIFIAVTIVALLACYQRVLAGMFDQWSTDEDMGHGFFVPVGIGFVIWRERKRWSQLSLRPSPWGVTLMLLAVCMHLVSAVGAGLFAGSVALVLTIVGAVLCLGGIPLLRAWSFPLLLILFMLPKLAVLYNQATLPLQLLASQLAAGMLTMSGVAVLRTGNILDVGGHQVAVAEACSGIRYLLPLAFTGVIFAYLADKRPWMRLALLAWAIPVAIVANAVRVAFSAYSPKLADGTLHALLGTAIFVACLATFIPIRTLWNRVTRTATHA
jgi:exosortase